MGPTSRKYREILGLHCFLKEASPTAEYLRFASLDIRKIKNCVQSRASCGCSGVDGFVAHKDGSLVWIRAGKGLDGDPMTVLERRCFGIGGQPRPLTMNRLGEI